MAIEKVIWNRFSLSVLSDLPCVPLWLRDLCLTTKTTKVFARRELKGESLKSSPHSDGYRIPLLIPTAIGSLDPRPRKWASRRSPTYLYFSERAWKYGLRKFPPSDNLNTLICSEEVSIPFSFLWKRKMLITSGATGGMEPCQSSGAEGAGYYRCSNWL